VKTIKDHIDIILSSFHSKRDLDEAVFCVCSFAELVDYKSVGGDQSQKRKLLIASEIKNIQSVTIRDYFTKLVKANEMWLFEPSHFADFNSALKNIASETSVIDLKIAVDLKDDDIQEIADYFSAKQQHKVILNISVDKSLIGGAIIKKDNYIMDFSLKNKLSTLSTQWKKSIKTSKDNE